MLYKTLYERDEAMMNVQDSKLKLLLVHKDLKEVNCLKRSAEFRLLGFEKVWTAMSVNTALDLLKNHIPDILIVDACLLKYDELYKTAELLSFIPEPCRVLVISSDNEVAMLKNLGQCKIPYTIKLYNDGQFTEDIVPILSQIVQQFRNAEQADKKLDILKKRFVLDCLKGNVDMAALDWYFDMYGIKSTNQYFVCIMQNRFEPISDIFSPDERDTYACIVFIEEGSDLRTEIGKFGKEYSNAKMGISCVHIGLQNISVAYKQAMVAYKNSGENYIVFYNRISVSENTLFTEEVMDFIRLNYSQDITLSHLAQKMNVSNDHLWHLIKKHTGKTFKTLLTEYRINQAQYLLGLNRYRIGVIGNMVGYRDTKHFGRVFKKVMNMSIREYIDEQKPVNR